MNQKISKFQNLKNAIKNKLLLIISVPIFAAWIIFLIVLAYFAHPNYVFFDYLHNIDVTSQYSIKIPLFRYIIEPICGLIFVVGKGNYDWLILFLFSYPFIRFIWLLIDKYRYNWRIKYHPIIKSLKESLDFMLVLFLIFLISILAIFGIVYSKIGAIEIANNYHEVLHLSIWIILILTLLKFILNCFSKFIGEVIKIKRNRKINKEKFRNRTIKEYKGFKKIAHYGIWEILTMIELIGIIFFINFIGLSIKLPTQRIDVNLGPNEFLFDFHVHTVRSDGFLSPEERVNWYIEQGIKGAAFSDHFNTRGAREAKKYVEENNLDFIVIMAQEYTADNIHLNIYGLEEEIIPDTWKAAPGSIIMNVSDMIQYVKSHGGYVTVNHYDRNSTAPYSYEQLRDYGVDGFEIVNEGDLYPEEIRQFCLDNNLACMGGSDIHTNYPTNTLVKLTLPDPNNITLDAIFTELKKNNHQVIQIKPYAENFKLNLEGWSDIIDVIEDFINYLNGLDVFQLTSWIIWSYGFYIFCILIYKRLRKIELKYIEKQIKS